MLIYLWLSAIELDLFLQGAALKHSQVPSKKFDSALQYTSTNSIILIIFFTRNRRTNYT